MEDPPQPGGLGRSAPPRLHGGRRGPPGVPRVPRAPVAAAAPAERDAVALCGDRGDPDRARGARPDPGQRPARRDRPAPPVAWAIRARTRPRAVAARRGQAPGRASGTGR